MDEANISLISQLKYSFMLIILKNTPVSTPSSYPVGQECVGAEHGAQMERLLELLFEVTRQERWKIHSH
jgi:hypothetical protein